MKYLVSIVVVFLIFGCQKEEMGSVKKDKEVVELKQPTYMVIDTRFEKLRQVALISVEKRRSVLEKENQCIVSAENREELSKCFNDANEKRKVLGDEIKKAVPKQNKLEKTDGVMKNKEN